MNPDVEPQDRLFFLTHAVGSIVIWSGNERDVQEMFSKVRDAKKNRESPPDRLEQAIEHYRAFEIHLSELALWLLNK